MLTPNVDHNNEPKLPTELEEYIFVLAADESISDAWTYTLVAKRVHLWSISRIFNIVVFSDEMTSPIRFNLPILERYAKHVRYLYLELTELVQHVSLFTNVKDLVICRNTHQTSHLEPLRTFNNLTRLSLSIHPDFKELDPLYFALFAKVTHLDLNSYCTSWSPSAIEPYIDFPRLTHLCVLTGSNTSIIELFLDRNRCPNLEVVIWWDWASDDDDAAGETRLTQEDEVEDFARGDERIIPLSVIEAFRDWQNGVKGGVDMWRVADREMALRRRGR